MISTAQATAAKPATPPAALPASGTSNAASALAGLSGANFARLLSEQAVPTSTPTCTPTSAPTAEPTAARSAEPSSPHSTAAKAAAPAPQDAAPAPARKVSAAPASKAPASTTRPADGRPSTRELQPPGEAAADPGTADALNAATASEAGDGRDALEAPADDASAGLAEFTQLIGLTPAAAPALPTPANTTAATQLADGAGGDATATAAAGTARHGRALAHADAGATDADSTAANASVDADADTGSATARAAGRTTPPGDGTSSATAARPAPPPAAASSAAAARQDATASAERSASLAPAQRDAASAGPTALPTASANPQAFAAVMQPLLGGAADTRFTPEATARVHASLHSTAFAPELGTRVSLMAVDGVQHAELQLNPAEMGPVTVQIVLDGSQAQVSFQAVQAETRAALEQSLPDLAAALQGQGLTLSGGGVFQQAQQDPGASDNRNSGAEGGRTGSASARGAPGGAADTAPAASAPRRSVGLLDTFA
ncbi:flagellar hook-length control protein FliK [Roseateles sp. BYS87W]|uniref:Flagellar hook-length control protein FliK n=1 Tax=Pelomonas baiyunensis TaxID=3299026 RepID=A0ABW7GUU7_9BURK